MNFKLQYSFSTIIPSIFFIFCISNVSCMDNVECRIMKHHFNFNYRWRVLICFYFTKHCTRQNETEHNTATQVTHNLHLNIAVYNIITQELYWVLRQKRPKRLFQLFLGDHKLRVSSVIFNNKVGMRAIIFQFPEKFPSFRKVWGHRSNCKTASNIVWKR